MVAYESENVKTPGTVLPGVNSQKSNQVGVHWLRISVNHLNLWRLCEYVSRFFGKYTEDGYGLWSYTDRIAWTCGASLNYDSDIERCKKIHLGKVTLDCPGGALDGLAADELQRFICGLEIFDPACTRIDIYFDDYRRTIEPGSMHDVVEQGDYSGFRQAQSKQRFSSSQLVHDEVDFGVRGQNGSGKYLRVYDKQLESKGEFDCVRWELELSKDRAKDVLDKLMSTDDLTVFATICGALIGGAITFVKRTGEKNIKRLELYAFWELIVQELGKISIRVKRERCDMDGVQKWIEKQVSPSLGCLREVFCSDIDFMTWLFDVLKEGESHRNQHHINLVNSIERKRIYRPETQLTASKVEEVWDSFV